MDWMDEIQKVTEDFYRTQEKASLTQFLYGNTKGIRWPDKWLPYFGGDPIKEIVDRVNWRSTPARPPYRLTFVSTGRWVYINKYKSRWMAAFDPALLGDLIYAKGDLFTTDRVVDFKIDFRAPCMYVEDKHKDDKAVPTKKWKFL